jgi:hypothetical protein
MAYTLTSPISITVGGVAHTLVYVNNPGDYGSEYLDKTTSVAYELRLKIRHSKEPAKPGSTRIDRHNVELTKTVYGVGGLPDVVTQSYLVIRNGYNAVATDVQALTTGLTSIMTTDNLIGMVGWRN